jgi:hypothetical protein
MSKYDTFNIGNNITALLSVPPVKDNVVTINSNST